MEEYGYWVIIIMLVVVHYLRVANVKRKMHEREARYLHTIAVLRQLNDDVKHQLEELRDTWS